jgi:hypothetical protein
LEKRLLCQANTCIQAFKDIARGESAAARMEKQLTALEQRIDHLLAQANEEERQMGTATPTSKGGSDDNAGKT